MPSLSRSYLGPPKSSKTDKKYRAGSTILLLIPLVPLCSVCSGIALGGLAFHAWLSIVPPLVPWSGWLRWSRDDWKT